MFTKEVQVNWLSVRRRRSEGNRLMVQQIREASGMEGESVCIFKTREWIGGRREVFTLRVGKEGGQLDIRTD